MVRSLSRNLGLIVLLALPAVLVAQSPSPGKTPADAVEEFMRAMADSNLSRVAELWGTSKGPNSMTQPKDYQKRVIIMQAFLHGVQSQALGDVPGDKGDMRSVTTRLSHNGCSVTLPVNVVQWKKGWLVHDFDLVLASQINKPCQNERRPGNQR